MNLLKPRFIIIISLLVLIALTLIYLKLQSQTNKATPPPAIQIFNYSPSPTVKPKVKIPPPTPPNHSPVPVNQLTTQQKIQYQAEADEYYKKSREAIVNNYPWYLNLPIQEQYYFIYFDVQTETFMVELYPQKSFVTPIDEQVDNMKKAVIKRISALGPDTSQYKIDWHINNQ